MEGDRVTGRLGAIGIAAWAAHAAHLVAHGQAENLLWGCHVGLALVSIGLLARAPRVVAPAAFLCLLGAVLWPIDVVVTGDLEPTSAVAHLTGIAIAAIGLRRLGLPPGTWLRAAALLVGLQALARLATPPAANVNLAFSVHPSAAGIVSSHAVYVALVGAAVTAGFFAFERAVIAARGARLTRSTREDEVEPSGGVARDPGGRGKRP